MGKTNLVFPMAPLVSASGRPVRPKRLTWKLLQQLPSAPAEFEEVVAPEPESDSDDDELPPSISEPASTAVKTVRNSFGIYREYLSHPTHNPEATISLADQLNIPGASIPGDTRLSPGSPASNATIPSINPFRNKTIFGFMNWMWSGSAMKSIAECQKLVNFILSEDFKREDLIGFDFKAETARFDKLLAGNLVSEALGNASGIKDGWKEVEVEIEVPDGTKRAASDPLPIFSVPGLHFRNLTQAIKSALEDRSSRHFHYTPFQQFWKRSNDEMLHRIYDEIYSSDAFIQAHKKLQRQPAEPNCTLERVIAALMFWSDSTHLANFGTASLWPLYLFFGNQSKWVRGKPRAGACHHIAYMPKVQRPDLRFLIALTNFLSIHPLVHAWSREIVWDPEFMKSTVGAILGMAISGISEQDMQLASVVLLPHVESVLGENLEIGPDFRAGYAWIYSGMGRYREAEKLWMEVLERRKEFLGDSHPNTLTTMGYLAITYLELGEYKKAQELQTVVLEKQKQFLVDNHPDALRAMGNLALTYSKLGEFKKAKELKIVVLEKRKQFWGDNYPDTLHTMGNLAVTYKSLGEFKKAQQLQIVVLDKQKQFLGGNHPDTLRVMGNLAITYKHLGEYKKAQELEIVVLKKQKQFLGGNHPDTLRAIGNLACTYKGVGEFKKAQELEIIVLKKRKQFLGYNHPDTLRAMRNLATTYWKLREFTKAEELELHVLQKCKQTLGDNHPSTLRAAEDLSIIYRSQDKLRKAKELRRLFGLSGFEDITGPRSGAVFKQPVKWLKKSIDGKRWSTAETQ